MDFWIKSHVKLCNVDSGKAELKYMLLTVSNMGWKICYKDKKKNLSYGRSILYV